MDFHRAARPIAVAIMAIAYGILEMPRTYISEPFGSRQMNIRFPNKLIIPNVSRDKIATSFIVTKMKVCFL